MTKQKITRGNASQFFVAGELCRRGYSAVVTLGNTPNTDILCSNIEGTKFVHIQVKTFLPGERSCSIGIKAEKYYGENFFWVLAGIPEAGSNKDFEYYIIPSKIMAENVTKCHQSWLQTPGINGNVNHDNQVRMVLLPPKKISNIWEWDITEFRNRWDLIEEKLKESNFQL